MSRAKPALLLVLAPGWIIPRILGTVAFFTDPTWLGLVSLLAWWLVVPLLWVGVIRFSRKIEASDPDWLWGTKQFIRWTPPFEFTRAYFGMLVITAIYLVIAFGLFVLLALAKLLARTKGLFKVAVIKLDKAFDHLKALDIRAGKLFGNADHIRAQNTDDISYALGLGARIVLIGTAAALLQCLVTFVAMFGDSTLNTMTGIAHGVILFVLAQAFEPQGISFALPLGFTLGIASLLGMVAGILRIDPIWFINANAAPIFSVPLGCLIALQIFAFLLKAISRAFDEPPPRRIPSIKRIRRAGLLTTDEDLRIRAIDRWGVPFSVIALASMLLCVPAGVIQPWLGVGCALAIFVCFPFMLLAVYKAVKCKKAILARLAGEHLLTPIILKHRIIIHVEDEVGFMLKDISYVGRKIYPAGYDPARDGRPLAKQDQKALDQLEERLMEDADRREIQISYDW